MVVLIGVFRLIKAAALLTLGVSALLGAKGPVVVALAAAADRSGLFWARSLIEHAIARILSLDAHDLNQIGVASLVYAAVFTVEGMGLVLRKAWAEWLTIIVTTSFVPFEVYEVIHEPGVGKAVALALNVAIVAYLIVRAGRGPRLSAVRSAWLKASRALSI